MHRATLRIAAQLAADRSAATSVGLIDQNDETPLERHDVERRTELLLRSIVSLLAMPGADAAAERSMVESFVVRVLIASPTSNRSQV